MDISSGGSRHQLKHATMSILNGITHYERAPLFRGHSGDSVRDAIVNSNLQVSSSCKTARKLATLTMVNHALQAII